MRESKQPIFNVNEDLTIIKEKVNSIYKNLDPENLEVDEWDYQVDFEKLELNAFSLD